MKSDRKTKTIKKSKASDKSNKKNDAPALRRSQRVKVEPEKIKEVVTLVAKKPKIKTTIIKPTTIRGKYNKKPINLDMYLFAKDIPKEDSITDDTEYILWRRDGASLIQKYYRNANTPTEGGQLKFIATTVYASWDERNRFPSFTIRSQYLTPKKDGDIKVLSEKAFQTCLEKGKTKDDTETDDTS